MRRKVNPEEVVQYRIETRAEYEEIAKHFKISRTTVENYIREVKENNPELKEKLEKISKTRRKQAVQKVNPKEVVQYRIETRATIKETAEHFQVSVDTVNKCIRKVKEKNPELKDMLEQIGKQKIKQKIKQRSKKVSPEEVVQYRIETKAPIEEIAKHFEISVCTAYKYIEEVEKKNPELKDKLKQISKTIRKQAVQKVNPEEVAKYRIETKASIEEIAKYFGISVATTNKYIKEVKEKNPELKEKLEKIRKRRSKNASPEEVVQYRIETKAPIEEIAKHFEISVCTAYKYIEEVEKKNPELKDKLKQISKTIRKQAVQKVNPEEVAKYRIETRATYRETAKHFGISVATVTNYIREVKENNPELIKQLEQAKQNKQAAFKGVKQENADLKAENTNLKARIVLLEQELKAYREGLVNVANGISNEHEEAETQMPEGKEIDVVLRAFDSGKISNQDALVLQSYQKKLMEQKAKLEKARKEDNLLSYTTMISAIRTLLSTHKPEYIQKSAELRKFISPEYYGPLYEIQDNMPIAKLISQIKNSTGMDVSSIEIALIINELNKEGQSNKVSDKINAEFIGRLRSRIESCNDKIEQETLTLAGGKNDNEEVR